jgi:hypothetical protein
LELERKRAQIRVATFAEQREIDPKTKAIIDAAKSEELELQKLRINILDSHCCSWIHISESRLSKSIFARLMASSSALKHDRIKLADLTVENIDALIRYPQRGLALARSYASIKSWQEKLNSRRGIAMLSYGATSPWTTLLWGNWYAEQVYQHFP